MDHRPIHEIARDIRRAWPQIHPNAAPYLDAMRTLTNIGDRYYEDSADTIVRYFIANAAQFKGEAAKALKTELRAIVGSR